MKILFYDIKDPELDYLLDKIPKDVEPYFFKDSLNYSTYVDEKFLDCEGLCLFVASEIGEDILKQFKNLKFIFLRSTGFSNVDLNYCKKNNIRVFNTPNYGATTVAEFAFSLLLTLSKKIIQAKNSVITGSIDHDELRGIELSSKTMGVIGTGAIGRKVINIAHGFNMEVLVYDINEKGAYNYVPKEELFQKSDFISINCPLNPTTKGMIDSKALSMMKKNVIIINTARGEIIDTEALYEALINKKILGAALDVIECEQYLCAHWKKCSQMPDLTQYCLKKFFFVDKLLKLDNVIITPHIAYNTKEARKRILDITLENIKSSFDINDGTKNLVLI